MSDKHQLLHERILGREAELDDPQQRAALVAQLSTETYIHPDFIEGYLDAFEDPSFETRVTRKLPHRAD